MSMYNRYIPNGTSYTRVSEPEDGPIRPQPQHPRQEPPLQPPPQAQSREPTSHRSEERAGTSWYEKATDPIASFLSGLTGGKKGAGLSGILEKFKLDDIDTGDILLILILLFLFRDGDDIELVITLGLILLLGLGDKDKKDED